MSSPRVTKIYQGMAEQLRRMGYKAAMDKFGNQVCIRWLGRVTPAGQPEPVDAVVIDLTSATWASGNLRATLVSQPATDYNNTAAFKTQSNAAGYYLDGSVSFQLYMETPPDYTGPLAQFYAEMMHILRGQEGAPVDVYLTANGTQATYNGVNGATSTATATEVKYFLPYGMTYPGGV